MQCQLVVETLPPGPIAINLRVLCRLLSIPPTPKGENIADKVENRISFPAVFSPLGVGGSTPKPPNALKLMAMGAGGW